MVFSSGSCPQALALPCVQGILQLAVLKYGFVGFASSQACGADFSESELQTPRGKSLFFNDSSKSQ